MQSSSAVLYYNKISYPANMFEDYIKFFGYSVLLMALAFSLLFAIPGMAQQYQRDMAPYSGAQPGCEVEYTPLNTLPPTYDNE